VDVAVVGAGLSGMAAARKVVQAGRSVVVLEASSRTGGRCHNALLKGAVCELGGEWVSTPQKHVMALIREFGLVVFPTYQKGLSTLHLNGKVERFEPPIPPLPGNATVEAGAAIAALDLMAAEVPLEAPQDAHQAEAWDSQTVATWLDDNVDSAVARTTLGIAAGGPLSVDPRDMSLLHYLFIAHGGGGADKLVTMGKGNALESRVVGGSGLIADGLAKRLGGRILLDTPVRTIDQSGKKVRVITDDGTFTAKGVIVAVPPNMCSRIIYDPPLPAARDQLTQRTGMGWAIKCFASYPTPFWRDQGLNGFVNNLQPGDPIDGVFDNSPPSGKPGVLFGLIEGDAARKWGPRSAAERKAAVLKQYATFFGPKGLSPTGYLEHDWANEPWIRGGASFGLPPGTWTEYGSALRAPVGRIHWASTETATEFCGFMDGAISAGERAAREVLST
jgi:monoamine oxidase